MSIAYGILRTVRAPGESPSALHYLAAVWTAAMRTKAVTQLAKAERPLRVDRARSSAGPATATIAHFMIKRHRAVTQKPMNATR
jgi:hypothetical protein